MITTQEAGSAVKLLGHEQIDRRPFSLALYLLIVFALSWPFLIASALWAKSILWSYLLNSGGMIMVTVGTILASKLLFREDNPIGNWSWGKPRQYVGILALISFLWLPPTLIKLVMGNIGWPLSIHREQALWSIVFLSVTLIPAFGEEFGWRGYLLPRLAARMGGRQAMLVHAVIWWLWHWPALIAAAVQMFKGGNAIDLPGNLFAAVALILVVGGPSTILHGVVFAWIWSKTESLAVVVAYHALYDGVRDTLAVALGGSALTSNTLAEIWPTAVICLLGLFLLWKRAGKVS